jgi:hypothetical protein
MNAIFQFYVWPIADLLIDRAKGRIVPASMRAFAA